VIARNFPIRVALRVAILDRPAYCERHSISSDTRCPVPSGNLANPEVTEPKGVVANDLARELQILSAGLAI
jgi:hypothetical protein